MGSQEDRERLKEEYKEHYRAIRELRKKAAESERMAKITSALENVNAEQILESFDNVLNKVREKIEIAEAKLEMAIDSQLNDHHDEELREIENKRKAQETIQKFKSDMRGLDNILEEKVQQIEKMEKTLGRSNSGEIERHDDTKTVKKSLGPSGKTK
jgi:hypothetical protein